MNSVMMPVSVWLILSVTIFITLCVTPCVRGLAVCKLHQQTDDGRLHFTEVMGKVHVGYENQFTSLVCSTRNFCDISWKKDGLPVNTSQVIGLEENGQNLVFKQLGVEDGGDYTCQASNGIDTIKTTIHLYVISSDCTSIFKPINLQVNSCNNQSANIGDNVTFDCRFFIGLPRDESASFFMVNKSVNASAPVFKKGIPLTSRIGETTFNKSWHLCGDPAPNGKQCSCQNCLSELCLKLDIFNLTVETFGMYILSARNWDWDAVITLEVTEAPDPPRPRLKPKDWHHFLTMPVACLIVLVCFLGLVMKRFNMDIKLKWKDFTGKRDDSKLYDVYLSYDWNSEIDRAFAINLARRLDEQGYRVFWEIHCLPGGFADDDILECLKTSCRCVIIFSPDYLSSHRNFDVIFAMDNAKYYKKEIIPIVYRDISMVTGEEHGALVKQILSLPCLRYDRVQSQPVGKVQKVWQSIINPSFSEKSLHKELLLRMPPPHKSRPSSYEDENSSHDEKHLNNGKVPAGQPASVVTTVDTGLTLYPDITRLVNDVELNSI